MKTDKAQSGFSLTETVVVVAIIALMITVAVPAVKKLNASVSSSVSAETLISGAINSARAIAAKNQKYAGIRFQMDKNNNQYMIAIVHDSDLPIGVAGNLGMKAVKGVSPVRLPDNIFLTDLKLYDDSNIIDHSGLSDPNNYKDATSFAVLFSPAGNLVVHKYWVQKSNTNDSIFNIQSEVDNGSAMFVEDATRESSRTVFYVINKTDYQNAASWVDYIDLDNDSKPDGDKTFYINPYTGSIIGKQ